MGLLIKHILVILHIITAAAWFGLGLRLSGQARTVASLTGEAQRSLADATGRLVSLMNVFVVLTLVFSIGAFIAGGHFAAYGPAYHSAVTLILVLVGVQLFVIRTGWNKLAAFVDGSGDVDAGESGRKRVAIGTGIGHTLWLVLLVLMFWNRILAALQTL